MLDGYIKVNGSYLNVDVRSELEHYTWNNARWTDTKLIASSPFRYDRKPSFFVNLDESSEYYGTWADSGAWDEEWASGGFIKLLSFLRDETFEETVDYLLFLYSREFSDEIKLPLLQLPVKRSRTPLDESKLIPYMFRHKYLSKRGISEPVQQLMSVGYDKSRKAVTMPWRLPNGRLANIKYRRVYTKVFWYEKGCWPVRELVYGIDVIYRKQLKYAVLCEAEIDAMSFMTAGVPAIAVGGSTITEQRAEVIRRSPLEVLYICTDNDTPGEKLRRAVLRKLGGYKTIYNVVIPKPFKDANEAMLGSIDLKKLVNESNLYTIPVGGM